MSERVDTARQLLDLADEHRKLRPVLRRAARLLLTGQTPDTEEGCRRCGRPLEQKPRGRPRKWCSDRCRRKVTEMGSLAA